MDIGNQPETVPQTTVYTQNSPSAFHFKKIIVQVGIVLAILIIISITAWAAYVYLTKKPNNDASQAANNSASAPFQPSVSSSPDVVHNGFKIYTNAESGFSIQYPASWQKKDITDQTTNQKTGVTLSGNEGDITFQVGSGFGGACDQQQHVKLSLKEQSTDACDIKNSNGTEVWSQFGKNVSAGISLNISATANSPADKNRSTVLTALSSLTFFAANKSQLATMSDWNTYDSSCQFTLNYPQHWNATKSFLANADDTCVYLTAPDYTNSLDTRSGLYMTIQRVQIGQKVNNITINSVDDYLSANQQAVSTTKVDNKTIGMFSGQQFNPVSKEALTEFVFLNGKYVYHINWPSEYSGPYTSYVDTIIGSIVF